MRNKILNGLFVLVFAVMFLPVVQKSFPFVNSGPLYGAFTNAQDVDFSWQKWWDGSYQGAKDAYINDQIAFRPDLVHLNNQIDYSLFSKLHFWDNMLGTNRTLWDIGYIKAYLGKDYIGRDSILHTLFKLKHLQDTLQRKGVAFVLVQAPCKAYFYPEYFPKEMKGIKRGPANLDTYSLLADSLGIHQIDFNKWFVGLKGKTPNLLYPRLGIHWSLYGAALAADSLFKYVRRLTPAYIPELIFTREWQQNEAIYTDDDIAKPLNLIIPFSHETYSYQQIDYRTDTTKKKAKMIYIGDSFGCQWMYLWILDNANSDWEYWNYFKDICTPEHRYGAPGRLNVSDIDWIQHIESSDCIVMLYTARNLTQLGNGFIEQAYAHYFPAEK